MTSEIPPDTPRRPLSFYFDSLGALKAFPIEVVKQVGYDLDRVQSGAMPERFSPRKEIGKGTYAITVNHRSDTFRVYFFATPAGVHVLYAGKKKSSSGRDDSSQTKRTVKERYTSVVAGLDDDPASSSRTGRGPP